MEINKATGIIKNFPGQFWNLVWMYTVFHSKTQECCQPWSLREAQHLKTNKLSSVDNMKDCVTFSSETAGHREPLQALCKAYL